MKYLYTLLLLCFISQSSIFAQTNSSEKIEGLNDVDTLSHFSSLEYRHTINSNVLYVGYWYNVKDSKNNKGNYHIMDVGFAKHNNGADVGYSYYIGANFLIDFKHFRVAPKIGGSLNVLFATLGAEVQHYTNLDKNSTYITPFFGIGVGISKLAISFPIALYNKEFLDTSIVSFGATFPLYTF